MYIVNQDINLPLRKKMNPFLCMSYVGISTKCDATLRKLDKVQNIECLVGYEQMYEQISSAHEWTVLKPFFLQIGDYLCHLRIAS